MITNNNIYGSYYSSLLAGVNLIPGSQKSSGANRAPHGGSASYGVVDIESANSLYAMKTGANKLHSVLSRLSSPSLFAGRAAVSSNPSAVEVSGSGEGALEIQITVSRTAEGQLNEGNELLANARVVSGTNEFMIEADGLAQLITIHITPGDNNKTLQDKMARAINERGAGIKASVKENGGRSTLVLESESTGEGAPFTLRDITGDAVSRTGANTQVRPPRNALFSVDGEEYESKTNEIDLTSGIHATLKASAPEPVLISMQTDATDAAKTISELAENINGLLQNAENAGASKIYRDISGAGRMYSAPLEVLGIKQDSRGYMSVDKDKLDAASKDGSLEKITRGFNATSYGYTQRISRVTQSAARNPAGYSLNATFNQFLGAGLYFNMIV